MSAAISNREFLRALVLAVAALALGAALLVTGYSLLVPVLHPEFEPSITGDRADAIVIPGKRFQPVVFGDAGTAGEAAVVSKLAKAPTEDHAVLVHRRQLRADQLPFLRLHMEGRNPALRVMLFWQRADAPGENHFAELDHAGAGPYLHNLLRHDEWKGTITELAVGLFGDLRGEAVTLHSVALEPYSYRGLLQTVWTEWTAFTPWTQSSINVYRGVPVGALVFPVPMIAAWLATGIVIIVLWRMAFRERSRPSRAWLPAAIAIGIAWAALDALWLQQLFRQNAETRYLFAGKTLHEKKLADWDGEYYAASSWIKDSWDSSADELIILHEESHLALAQRMRFHLLPELKASTIRPISRLWLERAAENFDRVVVLSAPGTDPDTLDELQEALTGKHTGNWRIIGTKGPVAIYATNRAKEWDEP
ncbi:MAG: hypothetical protein RJQ10_16990 [Haliea sp.]|uniref:hypothetical protein n=1 Tax=Haliea sp. TaxID=1932666 RepID=UPI0032EB07F2